MFRTATDLTMHLRTRAFATAMFVFAIMLSAPSAQAACTWPELSLMWSYPAEGESDVPINPLLWTATTGGVSKLEARLNGRVMQVVAVNSGEHRIDPGVLKPATRYDLELVYTGVFGGEENAATRTLHVRFQTGQRRTDTPTRPVVRGHVELEDDADLAASRKCHEYWRAQGCMDTMGTRPSKVHQFALAPSSSIGWLLRGSPPDTTLLWPASCGDPSVVIPNSGPRECVTLRALGQGGQLSGEQRYCAQETKEPAQVEAVKSKVPPAPSDVPHASTAPVAPDAAGQRGMPRRIPRSDEKTFGFCGVVAAGSNTEAPLVAWSFVALLMGAILRRGTTKSR